jgi:hypothetical protein
MLNLLLKTCGTLLGDYATAIRVSVGPALRSVVLHSYRELGTENHAAWNHINSQSYDILLGFNVAYASEHATVTFAVTPSKFSG